MKIWLWCVWCLLLLSSSAPTVVRSFQVTESFNVVRPDPTNANRSISFNRLSVLLSSTDGALGFNNRIGIQFQAQLVNSNNQKFTSTVRLSYTPVTAVYQKFVVGHAVEAAIVANTVQCTDRLQLYQQSTGAYGTTLNAGPVVGGLGTPGGATGAGSFSAGLLGVRPNAARVGSGSGGRREGGGGSMNLEGLLPKARAAAFTGGSSHARRLLADTGETPLSIPTGTQLLTINLAAAEDNQTATNIYNQVSQNLDGLAALGTDWLAQLQAQNITITNALSSYATLGAVLNGEAANYSIAFNTSLQYAAQLEKQYAALINQTRDTLNASYTQALAQLNSMDAATNAIALTGANRTGLYANMVLQRTALQAKAKAYYTTFQDQLQALLQSARLFDGSLTDTIQGNTARASSVAAQQLQRNYILNRTANTFQPFVSESRPYVNGLGFVPFHPGDNRYVVRLTIIYNSVNDPTIPQPLYDPDISLLNPSVPADQAKLQQYQQALQAASSTGYQFVRLRNVYFICSNDFQLKYRSLWFSFYDLKTFIAQNPAGCTPGVDCTCAYTFTRERCATSAPFVNTQSVTTLAGSGICNNDAELALWYNTNSPSNVGAVDNSITRMFASENVTTNDDFDAELTRMCSTPLTAGTEFGVATSTFSTAVGTPGIPLLVMNNVDFCSTNYFQMQVESTQNGITLPFMVNEAINVATQDLYRTVSTQWVLDDEGAEGVGVRHDQVTYFPRGVWRQPNTTYWHDLMNRGVGPQSSQAAFGTPPPPPPILSSCDVATTAYLSNFAVPINVLVLDHVEQTVNITVTDDHGNLILQQQQLQVSRETDPQSTLPSTLYIPGYLDCWDARAPCLFQDGTLRNLVYDVEDGGVTAAPSVYERYGNVDYVMQRYQTNASMKNLPRTPQGNFITHATRIRYDDFTAQEGLLTFDPAGVSDSLHRKMRALIPDPDPLAGGGWLCDPATPATTVAENLVQVDGVACDFHAKARLVPTSVSAFPNYDSSSTLQAALKSWGPSLFYFDIPATSVTALPSQTLTCPNPEQVQLLFSAPLTPQLSINNQHSFEIVVSLVVTTTPLSNLTACNINTTVPVAPGQTSVVSLLAYLRCPATQNIVLSVNDTVGSLTVPDVCWTFSGNMTQLAAQFAQQQLLLRGQSAATALAQSVGNVTLSGVNETAVANVGLGTITTGTDTKAAAANLVLSQINRLTVYQQQTTSTLGQTMTVASALTLTAANNLLQFHRDVAQVVADQIAHGIQVGLLPPSGPTDASQIPWNATALQKVQALVLKQQSDQAIFRSLVQTASVTNKQEAAILSTEQTALQNNISTLVNKIQNSNLAALNYLAGAKAAQAQATNLTANIIAAKAQMDSNIIKITAAVNQLKAIAANAKGCPGPEVFGPVTDKWWNITRNEGLTFLGLLHQLGQDITDGANALVAVATAVFNDIYDPNCSLKIAILCDIENLITKIIGVILTILVIAICIYGVYFCLKFTKSVQDVRNGKRQQQLQQKQLQQMEQPAPSSSQPQKL